MRHLLSNVIKNIKILKNYEPFLSTITISKQQQHSISTNNNQNQNVRVRFAPSPTGKLHIGGLRTAFYNYLLAKKYNGTFILRLEDTDRARFQSDSLSNIIDSLNWIKIKADFGPTINNKSEGEEEEENKGPWIQSERLDIYSKYASQLIESKKAYYCFCDEARLSLLRKNSSNNMERIGYDNKCRHLDDETVNKYLKEGRSFVIRFKLTDKQITFDDFIYGSHSSNLSKQENDFVIIKSDKYPTYHFANIVDDHLMKITHVLRGFESFFF
jgi:glutamyl-tRNA synthetase